MGPNSPPLPSSVSWLLQVAAGKATAPMGQVWPGHRLSNLSWPGGTGCVASPSLVTTMATIVPGSITLETADCY